MGKLFDAWELGMHGCETNSCAGLDSVTSKQLQQSRAVSERCATGCDHNHPEYCFWTLPFEANLVIASSLPLIRAWAQASYLKRMPIVE